MATACSLLKLKGKWIVSDEATLSKLFLSLFLKGIYLKRKEFTPKWSIFFPFKVDPFSEVSDEILSFRADPFKKGLVVQESKDKVPKVVSLFKKMELS